MQPALRIEDNGVPVYVQIREQMLRAIGAGALKPGEQMPTMRAVAVALKVDLNTVRHAYGELEQLGAIVILRARGTYVAPRPPALDAEQHSRRAQDLAQQAIATAQSTGVDAGEVAQRMLHIMQSGRE